MHNSSDFSPEITPMCIQHNYLTETSASLENANDIYLSFAACLNMASRDYYNGNVNEANAVLARAINFAQAMSDRKLKVMAAAICLAKQSHFAKQYGRARELYSKALNLFPICHRSEDLVYSDLMSGLAETEFLVGNYFIARHHLQQAIEIDRRVAGEQSDQYRCHSSQLSAVEYAQRVRCTANYCTPKFAKSA
ncbi:MAG: tetratricopeptide repeat protein [Candidatus Melainabacteria bacterium]|nr:tetratricopeptide repeat protein [Candidatus Melainabacteria bacterium]